MGLTRGDSGLLPHSRRGRLSEHRRLLARARRTEQLAVAAGDGVHWPSVGAPRVRPACGFGGPATADRHGEEGRSALAHRRPGHDNHGGVPDDRVAKGPVVSAWWWAAVTVAGVFALVGVYDLLQRRHAILRNFPVIGHLRCLSRSVPSFASTSSPTTARSGPSIATSGAGSTRRRRG